MDGTERVLPEIWEGNATLIVRSSGTGTGTGTVSVTLFQMLFSSARKERIRKHANETNRAQIDQKCFKPYLCKLLLLTAVPVSMGADRRSLTILTKALSETLLEASSSTRRR